MSETRSAKRSRVLPRGDLGNVPHSLGFRLGPRRHAMGEGSSFETRIQEPLSSYDYGSFMMYREVTGSLWRLLIEVKMVTF